MQKFFHDYLEGGMIEDDDGDYYLVIEVDAEIAKKDEDWQLKYDLLMQDYEAKWGLSMRLEKEIAALQSALEAEIGYSERREARIKELEERLAPSLLFERRSHD